MSTAITEISLADLDMVNGGWAREGLRNAGEAVGGAIDDTGMAIYNAGKAGAQFVKDAAVATWNTGVAISDGLRTGTANILQAGADFVRPPCRK